MYALKKISIPKGKHRGWPRFRFFWRPTVMLVMFRFDETAKYVMDARGNQKKWNKICGFSRGFHHTDSVRLCWRWNIELKTVEVCEYSYRNKELHVEKVQPFEIGKDYSYILKIHDGSYPSWSYLLSPYFGGRYKAPQVINIYLSYKV